ncbi:MAG: hypothetical protein HYR58_08070 [Acidobacteria bacterium]|nr:hypothetical protein [Acidobacteriota bacterium]
MRRWWQVIIRLAACSALVGSVAVAQQEKLPTVEKVLADYVRAVGGRAAIEKVRSRVTTGTVDAGNGVAIPLVISEKAPDKYLQELNVPEIGAVVEGFDGNTGWESNPQMGAQELTGTSLAARKRNSQFYRWLRMRELFAKLDLSGTTKVGERDAYVLEATPQEGYEEKFYFDMQTGLLLQRDYKLEGPDGVLAFNMFYEEYKVVDGIKLPFALRRVGPDNVLLLKFTEIKQNVELDDARFAKPVAP